MHDRSVIKVPYRADTPSAEEWAAIPSYSMALSHDRVGIPQEGGTVRFVWNSEGIIVRAELTDSCLISTNRHDEQLHYQCGDVFELFLKPLNAPYKWEMYATPYGNKSTLFFPTWPTTLTVEESLRHHNLRGLKVSVETTSTGWTAQMSVPAADLTAMGMGWGAGFEWTAFCGRYNCNQEDLKTPELSMFPAASATNYHLIDEYAILDFLTT